MVDQERIGKDSKLEMKKILGNVQAGVDEKINKLTEKVEVQTNEFISARDDVKELQKKVFELEKHESDVNAMWKEKKRKRDLEDKIKKDFRDEEAKLIVIGQDFGEENRNLVDDLMEEILKEDVEPIGKMRLPKSVTVNTNLMFYPLLSTIS